MNNNLEFENEDPSPDSIEDNHPRTNYGEGYGGKETLEEAAERLFPFTKDDSENRIITIKRLFWIEGVKWQQERMYSEEEVVDIMFELLNQKREECCITHTRDSIVRKVFEQFKKK